MLLSPQCVPRFRGFFVPIVGFIRDEVLGNDVVWVSCGFDVNVLCVYDPLEGTRNVAEDFAFRALGHVGYDVNVEAIAEVFGRRAFLFEGERIVLEAATRYEALYALKERAPFNGIGRPYCDEVPVFVC